MKYCVNMLAKPMKITTTQMDEHNVNEAMEIYLKNAFVSLTSVKSNNTDIECILFMNFKCNNHYVNKFNDNGIKLEYLEYGKHIIADGFAWSIVQYRYDILEYMSKIMLDEDQLLMLDTDTICTGSLNNLFEEAKYNILLFDVQHDCQHPDRKNIIDNYYKIYGEEDRYLIHYGGEIIVGNGILIRKLYECCLDVINASEKIEKNIKLINWNDEHITSIAVHRFLRGSVNNANAYIYRYWTGNNFYLISSNYKNNAVCIWHVPNEKSNGFIYIYIFFNKYHRFPSVGKLIKIFGITKSKRPKYLIGIWIKIQKKFKIM